MKNGFFTSVIRYKIPVRLLRVVSLVMALCLALSLTGPLVHADNETAETAEQSNESGTAGLVYYKDVMSNYDLSKPYDSQPVTIDLSAGIADGQPVEQKSFSGEETIYWDTDEIEELAFSFTCAEGLYSIRVSYYPLAVTTADIVRSLQIDGTAPFVEASTLKFRRQWVSDGDNTYDVNGDERAAPLVQQEALVEADVRDLDGLYVDPLLFYLEAGEHTMQWEFVTGSLAIQKIELIPYAPAISYEEYRQSISAPSYDGEALFVQGETSLMLSDRTITSESVNNAAMTPFELGKTRLNAIGGWNWRNGNEEAFWEVPVETSGWYTISLRISQDYDSLVTYRQVRINGKVPFAEANAIPFYAESGYRTVTLGGEEPYEFYLQKGDILSLSVVTGGMTDVINELTEIAEVIGEIVTDIRTVTGVVPDPNFDYELDEKLPWIPEELQECVDRLTAVCDRMMELCGTKPYIVSSILGSVDSLEKMLKKPETMAQKLDELSQLQGTLSDHTTNLKAEPLAIDYIQFSKPGEVIVQRKQSFWQALQIAVTDFIGSFIDDYSSVDSGSGRLEVWVSRGREWGEVTQRLADELFTPQSGIQVNVNILPSGYGSVVSGTSPLLLSIVAGNEPDVAMGSDMDTPIELAIRGGAVDLSEFSSFDSVAARFPAGAVDCLRYNDGVYALPETMDFPMLIYRTDIFAQYDIPVPDTWEELWQYTLPKLRQINANFYYAGTPDRATNTAKMANFTTFLYQNGGELYNEDGSSALDTEEAFNAFNEWTKGFVQYQSPQSANFYNEMRTGTLPIGVSYTGDYLMLDVAAPELSGRLGIAPIPGTEDEDGNIIRYGSGSVSTAMIFESSNMKREAWEFLEWWTSGDVQERFASEIEAQVGPTARWFSANTEALFSLGWGRENTQMLEDWFHWYKNPYNTLGGYMTSRSISNAWTRTVMSGMKARDSLEQAYNEIAIQIGIKQKEYGVN